ncbi:MAG: protein translocase subunit SecF [Candidatus Limnocylindria bacterium]
MYDIVGKRNWYFAFSAILTVPGLIFILIGGLQPSIDFTGGTEWEVRHASEPTGVEIQAALTELGYEEAAVTELSDGFVRIRTEPIDLIPAEPVEPDASGSPSPDASPAVSPSPDASPAISPSPSPTPEPVVAGTDFAALQDDLEDQFGAAELRIVRTVGPIIGADLIRSSAILIVVGELFILAYLWMRFGFRFGTCAIVALLHDVILVVGAFAIGGYLFGLEFDALFVTALLTIIAFSVHDTIVVFDRIRENRVRHAGEPFGAIVNHSILQTLGRSIITSVTVLATLLALLLLGPDTIRTFAFALVLGVLSGTYSSIFNASQLLVAWHEWDAGRKARAGAPGRAVKPLSR